MPLTLVNSAGVLQLPRAQEVPQDKGRVPWRVHRWLRVPEGTSAS